MAVPLLLTNPRPKKKTMATKKKKTTRRRRPRRRKNPSMDVGGVAVAGGVGATLGAAQWGLDGTNMTRQQQGLAMLAVGGIGGALVSMASDSAAKGLAGAGLCLASYLLISDSMTRSADKAESKGGEASEAMSAVRAELGMGAVRADLGAVRADLGAMGMAQDAYY